MITPTKSRPSQVSTTLIGKTNLSAVHNTRSKESFRFALEIVKPWGGLEPILEWCKSELQQDWRWQMIDMSTDQRPGRYIFYFDGEQDCLAFTLKWG
jgi:hypothetical protein